MNHWSDFPTRVLGGDSPLFRIHRAELHPAWFNNDGQWRFDPAPSHRERFGVCYLGSTPLTSYVEVFGRFRVVPQIEIDRRTLSEMTASRTIELADLTDRSVLGEFGITAAHSVGTDYGPAQELASNLYDAGIDGILYRVRHDPAMNLEGIALFGVPGESPERFSTPKTTAIPADLIAAGYQFHIEVVPTAPLP